MKRYTTNNIDNDLTRMSYTNTSPKNFNQSLNFNHKMNNHTFQVKQKVLQIVQIYYQNL